MRKVIYKTNVLSPDNKRWSKEDAGEALFHGFGVDYEEFESGPGNFSTAILELPCGSVMTVRADDIRFID